MRAHPLSVAVTLAVALVGLSTPGSAHAQVPDEKGALADAWMRDILERQQNSDDFLRYVGAPAGALMGGSFLAVPAFGELPAATDLAYAAAGAAWMTAAIGAWGTSDPHAAYRWYGSASSLGFISLGVGLAAMCMDDDSHCGEGSLTRPMGTAIGIIDAGLFLTSFVMWMLSPPPSPRALSLSLRGLPSERRHARVHAFLQERERVRRLGGLLAAPWGIAMGVSFVGYAHEAASAEGRAVMYAIGAALLAFTTGATLYELLYTPDSERFLAGQRPDG
jgi:hypothetical protein